VARPSLQRRPEGEHRRAHGIRAGQLTSAPGFGTEGSLLREVHCSLAGLRRPSWFALRAPRQRCLATMALRVSAGGVVWAPGDLLIQVGALLLFGFLPALAWIAVQPSRASESGSVQSARAAPGSAVALRLRCFQRTGGGQLEAACSAAREPAQLLPLPEHPAQAVAPASNEGHHSNRPLACPAAGAGGKEPCYWAA